MADDAEATLREGLIAPTSIHKRATKPIGGSESRPEPSRLRFVVRLVLSIFLIPLFLEASWWSESSGDSAGQSRDESAVAEPAAGTPVVQAPDPLDSLPDGETIEPDPLDGAANEREQPDEVAAKGLDELPIVRSGRSRGAPDSSVSYDRNRSTAWLVGEVDANWVWLDLGEQVRLRELRWLTTGSGTLTVEVSDDREKWREVGMSPFDDDWSVLELRDDTRYVRLTFSNDATDDASLVELAVFGQRSSKGAGGSQFVDSAQEREQRANDRKGRRDRSEQRPQRAANDELDAVGDGSNEANDSGLTVSTKPGKTKCKGEKARCRANEGKTRVEDDCATEGTCVIDVRADGGTAICDASGEDDNETGQGEGKRPGRGGRCEATADGGTVTIGDISP